MRYFLSCCKHKLMWIIKILCSRDVPYLKCYYAQEGEECILQEFFGDRKDGVYVDIGAHHPFAYSNTWSFYKRGWHGINIDAAPGSMKLFKKFRKRDINLEVAVAEERRKSLFYLFREPALNGFLSEEKAKEIQVAGWELIETKEVETMPLRDILAKHLSPETGISFMTLDVEGMELEVLKSNDWEKFRPEVLVVEIYVPDFEQVAAHPITAFLTRLNYRPVAKNCRNVFFQSNL